MQHHFPANDVFESMSLWAWLITIAFLGIYWRYKAESLSVFVFPLVFVMTLVAALRNPVSHWSSEAVRSTWLYVHIVLALLGYAALLFTAIAASCLSDPGTATQTKTNALFLPVISAPRHARRTDLALARRGFRLHHHQHHHRHLWAYIDRGASWIDNGLISSASITWGIYLALIFFRVSAGWRGRKAAILAIVALCCSAIAWMAHAQLERRLIQ